MTNPPFERSSSADQVLGAAVGRVNDLRVADMLASLARQEVAFENAMGHIEELRDFLGSPESILGNAKTKHGEIAEAMEVHLTNAKDALAQEAPTATLDVPGGRTGPVDYNIDGVDFQSKFCNGIRNGFDAVKQHSADYPNFLPDGGKYMLPRDQYEKLLTIGGGGAVEGLSEKQTENIRKWLREFEAQTGKPFTETLQAGTPSYAETQQGAAHDTVSKHEQQLKDKQEELNKEIELEHQASLAEGLVVAGQAAAIAGGISFATMAWKFHKQGKNIFKGDLTAADWKAMGVEVGTSAIVGAVTAGGIYVLTNCADLAAPLAGALASAVKGVGSLVFDYHAGRITMDELVKSGLYVCSETAVVSLASVAGQTLIPIPVVGALIGSLAGKLLLKVAGKAVKGLQPKVDEVEAQLQAIVAKYEIARELLAERFSRLDSFVADAFNPELNARLVELSVSLAANVGVHTSHILKDHEDLGRFLDGQHALNRLTSTGDPI